VSGHSQQNAASESVRARLRAGQNKTGQTDAEALL